MADFEILIKTEGAAASAGEFDKVTTATKKTTEATKDHTAAVEKHVHVSRSWITGLRELTREVPILGYLVHSLHNPITLLGLAGAGAFIALRKSMDEAKESQKKWNESADKLHEQIGIYGALKTATDQLKESQDVLAKSTKSANEAFQKQIDLLGEQIEAQIKALEADKELEAAKIEATEKDPVNRARRLAENEADFGARISAMRGSLPGQQAQVIEKQIEKEKQLQRDAEEEVPNRAALREQVGKVEEDRADLEQARRDNRRKMQRAGLLELVTRLIPGEDIFGALSSGQLAQLRKEGVLTATSEYPQIIARAKELLPGAQAESAEAKKRVPIARSRLRAGIGALPKGVVKAGVLTGAMSVEDFVDTAEAEAAGNQNASVARQASLQEQHDKLLRQQQGIVTIDRINRQTAGLRGGISINNAERARDDKEDADRKRIVESVVRGHGAARSNNSEVSNMVEGLINVIEAQGRKIRALNDRIKKLENREMNQH